MFPSGFEPEWIALKARMMAQEDFISQIHSKHSSLF